MENIDFAVRIFKLILNTDSIDLSNKEVYDKIKNYYSNGQKILE